MIVAIALGNSRVEVKARYVKGVFAVTPAPNTETYFRVTHIPTGLAIGGPMRFRTAKAIAIELAGLGGWDKVTSAATMPKRLRKAGLAILRARTEEE